MERKNYPPTPTRRGANQERKPGDPGGSGGEAEAAEMGTYKCCIFFTRRFAPGEASTPEDVRTLFSRFSGGTPYMGVDELRRYLAATGEPDAGGDAEMDAAERIVDRILQGRSRTPRFGKPALTVDDFHSFLFSEELNPPIRQAKVPIRWSLDIYSFYLFFVRVNCGDWWFGYASTRSLHNVVNWRH
jgi:phosphatidylinositol phospholipase C delta